MTMNKEQQLAELRAQVEAMENQETAKVDPKEFETRAVEQFIRKQDDEELRAMTTGTEPGKLIIPTHLSKFIVEKLYERAPLFARARSFTPVNGSLEILRENLLGTAGFVGEMNNVPTSDFAMKAITLDQKRVGTAIELSQQLVNDSGIDIVNYATNVLVRRMGHTLDRTILNGDKATQFEGLLNSVEVKDAVTAKSQTEITTDELLDLYNSMNPEYLDDAVFVVNRVTFDQIAKLKDGNGHYFLVSNFAETKPVYKLLGRPILINDAMPFAFADARSVLFANMSEGYATMTKKGLNLQHISGDTTQALRGSHLILLDGYMDGKVLNPEAIRFLKQAQA